MAEGARSALRTSVRIAENEQGQLKRQLRQLHRGISDSDLWFRAGLKSYDQTAQSTGQLDPELRQAADRLLEHWQTYRIALLVLEATSDVDVV